MIGVRAQGRYEAGEAALKKDLEELLRGPELDEAHRRRIWNGYRGGINASAQNVTNEAKIMREFLIRIGQVPDFSIVLKAPRHGRRRDDRQSQNYNHPDRHAEVWAEAVRLKPLCAKIATDYLWMGLEIDDLIQEGLFGARRAVQLYDSDRGVPLVKFARHQIRAAMKAAVGRSQLIRVDWRAKGPEADAARSYIGFGNRDPVFQSLAAKEDDRDPAVLAEVRSAVKRLPKRCRVAIERTILEGNAVKGMAKELGIRHQTFRDHLNEGLRQLRAMLA